MAIGADHRLVGRTASELAAAVGEGSADPVDVLRDHLGQIEALDGQIGAFETVRARRAAEEAEALRGRADLSLLPLAGVPMGVKDLIALAGEPMRYGSRASSLQPRGEDHEVVARLKAAGAIIVGTTRIPELGLWATTDNVFGTTRNPWDRSRTPGGSSGGSAAAVAAAMVPVAHATDGLGSIRVPAACSGVFGMKPGNGLVPCDIGVSSWRQMAQNGVLATTVDDAALVLSVMADRSELRSPRVPDRPLRIAVSTKSPLAIYRVDPAYRLATRDTGRLLSRAGHEVLEADPPYRLSYVMRAMAWWFADAAEDAEMFDFDKLEHRTRRHVGIGRSLRRRGWTDEGMGEEWATEAEAFLADYDLLITPTLAGYPLRATRWHRRSWVANYLASPRMAPFPAWWNFCGFPAAGIPAGIHPKGLPMGVQLVTRPEGEGLILSVAKQLETLRPWARHAPVAGV